MDKRGMNIGAALSQLEMFYSNKGSNDFLLKLL